MSDVLIWGCVLLAFVCGYVLGTAHEHRRTVETVDAHWESLERTRATQPASTTEE